MVYRLLCQQSPCVPEIYAHLAGLQLMRRTFFTDTLYAPLQKPDIDLQGNNRCVSMARILVSLGPVAWSDSAF